MPDTLALFLAATGTMFATGLGAIPVFLLGLRAAAAWQPYLLGVAAGAMGVASVVGLIVPGLQRGSVVQVGAGLLVGALFVHAAHARLEHSEVRVRGQGGAAARSTVLWLGVLFVHSLPEGMAMGTAWATESGLGLFVVLAIALQNIPEGTSAALPMQESGFGPAGQFWGAVATSLPQPIGAVGAYYAVEAAESLLPVSLGFAAGAMLMLIVSDVIPKGRAEPARALRGAATGALAMLALTLVAG